jgi:hypothetical protein
MEIGNRHCNDPTGKFKLTAKKVILILPHVVSILFMSLIESLPRGKEAFLVTDHARRKNGNKE